jgi:hypothetical protein
VAAGENEDGRLLGRVQRDGRQVAETLRDRARSDLPEVEVVADLPPDAPDPGDWLRRVIADSIFLAVWSDSYASRAWCRFEARTAKAAGVPMIVVHALQRGEERGPTSLGNVPTVRWTGLNADDVFGLSAREALRCYVARGRFDQLRRAGHVPPATSFLVRRPEPLDWRGAADGAVPTVPQVIVYPDPALDEEELQALRNRDRTAATFVTLTGDDHNPFLTGRRIGLSGTAPAPGELGPLGLGPQHFQDTFATVARRLLGHGADLVYGGDVRAVGLGAALVDLARGQYPAAGRRARLTNFLAWPIYLDLNIDGPGGLRDVVDFRFVPPPSDLVSGMPLDPTVPLPPDDSTNRMRHREIRVRCLTELRRQMVEQSDAFILIGGKVTGYLGFYPGVIDELMLALRRSRPVYVLGGWGGCARAVAAAVRGETPAELTDEFQFRDPELATIREEILSAQTLGSADVWGNYYEIVGRLRTLGGTGLRNGLSADENERLMTSVDRDETVFLLTKGLRQVWRPDPADPSMGPAGESSPATEPTQRTAARRVRPKAASAKRPKSSS